MQHFGPKTVLTSIVNDWGPHYIRSAQAVMDGTWKSEDFWGGLAEYGGPAAEPGGAAGAGAGRGGQADRVDPQRSLPPLHRADPRPVRQERFAAGVSATNADLASMNYYVEGIKADLPK